MNDLSSANDDHERFVVEPGLGQLLAKLVDFALELLQYAVRRELPIPPSSLPVAESALPQKNR